MARDQASEWKDRLDEFNSCTGATVEVEQVPRPLPRCVRTVPRPRPTHMMSATGQHRASLMRTLPAALYPPAIPPTAQQLYLGGRSIGRVCSSALGGTLSCHSCRYPSDEDNMASFILSDVGTKTASGASIYDACVPSAPAVAGSSGCMRGGQEEVVTGGGARVWSCSDLCFIVHACACTGLVSVCLSVCLSLCLCLSVCLSVSLSLSRARSFPFLSRARILTQAHTPMLPMLPPHRAADTSPRRLGCQPSRLASRTSPCACDRARQHSTARSLCNGALFEDCGRGQRARQHFVTTRVV